MQVRASCLREAEHGVGLGLRSIRARIRIAVIIRVR